MYFLNSYKCIHQFELFIFNMCYVILFETDLQVDKVLADDGLPLGSAGLVEGPRLLLRPGHILRGRPAQD